MAEVFSVKLSSNFKTEIESYFRAKEGRINPILKAKLFESMEYLRDRMADYAPSDSGELREIINSLPISATSGTKSSFSFTESGSIQVIMRLDRRKDRKIVWADKGTGTYGPFRRVIRPINGEFLVFEVDGQFIKTRSTLGKQGTHFIRSAIRVSKTIITSKIISGIRSA